MLNLQARTRAEIAQMSAHPHQMFPDSMRGNGEDIIRPSGKSYYEDPSKQIFAVKTGENYPISLEITKATEEAVKDWFHVNFFLILSQSTRQMTMPEVVGKQGEKIMELSDMITNLNGSLSKIVERTFNLTLRGGRIPNSPSSLRTSGAELAIEFIGHLARAQEAAQQQEITRNYDKLNKPLNPRGMVAQIAEAAGQQ